MAGAVIILAAGKGTRMRSDLPKVLHPIGGAPMLIHAMRSARSFSPDRTVIVAGHGADAVEAAAKSFDPAASVVLQTEQNGTAHATDQARDILSDYSGDAVVLFGDTPFISPETLASVFEARKSGADVVVLGFEAEDPHGYGRLICNGPILTEIVETKDASPEQLKVGLCNSGVMAADRETLFDLISAVQPHNAQGEYYLTDIVAIANDRGLRCEVVTCPEAETLGVNSRSDLAAAERIFQQRARGTAMAGGATLVDPGTVYFAHDTQIGKDVVIEPNVFFGPAVSIGDNVTIKAFCHLEACTIAEGAQIGPYARLRPGTKIGPKGKIGNFVETKNADVQDGAKVNHLSYIGDATVGPRANIGAGTITCNYDGVFKHHTDIGADAFIGSNSALVAPVKIGADALVGSGTVVTMDVADGDLTLARPRQTNKPGFGAKLKARLRDLKRNGKRP